MKRGLIVAICILTFSSIQAQDLIVLKNADEILAKVISITPDSVNYKKWSNLEGPTYLIPKSSVFYIKYQNEDKDIFNDITPTKNNKQKTQIRFEGYLYGGVIFNKHHAGPSFDVTLGVNFFNCIYTGIKTGFYTNFGTFSFLETKQLSAGGFIPIGENLKIFFVRNKPVAPFFDCTISGFWGIAGALKKTYGLCGEIGFGINTYNFTCSIGYFPIITAVKTPEKFSTHCGYIKLGVRF